MKLLGQEDGYIFTIRNVGQVPMRGGLLAFLADTPASHAVGGFKEGVAVESMHCFATFETIQKCFEEDLFQLKNQKDHEDQLLNIENCTKPVFKGLF